MKGHDHPLNVLDLYSAVGGARGPQGDPVVHAGWGTAAHDRGHNVKTVDWDEHGGKRTGLMPDLSADITQIDAQDIMDLFGGEAPDLMCASPPCEGWSLQQIGNTWNQPEQWGDPKSRQGYKRLINQLRGTGEDYPDELKWSPKNVAGQLSNRTMGRTFDLMEDLRDINPDMFSIVENPVSPLRYHPTSFGDWDMANVQHASYHEPASSQLFGIPIQPPREGVQALGGVPELKPTDFFGYFPSSWSPRGRLKSGADKTKDILHGTNILYQDYPGSEGRRSLSGDEVQDLIAGGGSKDFMERMQHSANIGNTEQWWRTKPRGGKEPGWYPPPDIRGGQFAGSHYAAAPAGAQAGVNKLGPISFINRAGESVKAPAYYSRSLIPYGEGLDAILATETAHGLSHAPSGQPTLNPRQVMESFMRG